MYCKTDFDPAIDAELLAGAASGTDRNALPTLMKRHVWMKGLFHNMLHNTEEEKDAWQDAWKKVWEYLLNGNYLRIKNFKAWLQSVAINISKKLINRRKYFDKSEEAWNKAENTGSESCIMKLDEEDAEIMLRTLPPQMSMVVRKRVIENKSVEETAEELHISKGTVKSSCKRGLGKLRRNRGI